MYRTELCAVLLCVSFYYSLALKKCDDCVTFWECEAAQKLVKNRTKEKLQLIFQSSCGTGTVVGVCCLDFETAIDKSVELKTERKPSKKPNVKEVSLSTSYASETFSPRLSSEIKFETSDYTNTENSHLKLAKVIEVETSSYNNRIIDQLSLKPEISSQHENLKLLNGSCGDITSISWDLWRISSGTFSELYEFPWMALISYKTGKLGIIKIIGASTERYHLDDECDGLKYACSGSLINSRYVLTAAHCVVNYYIWTVRIGDYDLRSDVDCVGNVCEGHIQDKVVEEVIAHEGYNHVNFEHDIALLRLRDPVDMSYRNARPVCLPITEELKKESISGKPATVAGWGYTEHRKESTILLKVMITVHPEAYCENFNYNQLSHSNETWFCAGGNGLDSCEGDSGGPLMIPNMYNGDWKYIQYGIVSAGPRQCGAETPGVYTDVRKYIDWIADNIKE